MDQKQFDKNVKTIKATGAKMDIMLHECAMYALDQVNTHGRPDAANKLLGAMGKSMRRASLYVWFNDFGKCNRKKDNTLEANSKKKLTWDGAEITGQALLDVADEHPFFDYTKDTAPPSSYDVMQGIKSILRRADKMAKDGKTIEHKELLEQLKAFVPVE